MNIDPFQAVQEKMLREDLFYRLNVVSLRLPDLAERSEDFPLLLDHFIAKFNRRFSKKVQGFGHEAYTLMQQHSWPGNVREMENIVEGTMNDMDGVIIQIDDLPQYLRRNRSLNGTIDGEIMLGEGETLNVLMNRMERQLILKAYHQTGENITQTARTLGLPRQTLQYRLGKLGIKT
jgi:arginine utilization regulatory protein